MRNSSRCTTLTVAWRAPITIPTRKPRNELTDFQKHDPGTGVFILSATFKNEMDVFFSFLILFFKKESKCRRVLCDCHAVIYEVNNYCAHSMGIESDDGAAGRRDEK